MQTDTFSLSETAAELGVSVKTVQRWIAGGKLRAGWSREDGRTRAIARGAVEALRAELLERAQGFHTAGMVTRALDDLWRRDYREAVRELVTASRELTALADREPDAEPDRSRTWADAVDAIIRGLERARVAAAIAPLVAQQVAELRREATGLRAHDRRLELPQNGTCGEGAP